MRITAAAEKKWVSTHRMDRDTTRARGRSFSPSQQGCDAYHVACTARRRERRNGTNKHEHLKMSTSLQHPNTARDKLTALPPLTKRAELRLCAEVARRDEEVAREAKIRKLDKEKPHTSQAGRRRGRSAGRAPARNTGGRCAVHAACDADFDVRICVRGGKQNVFRLETQ